MVSNFVVVDVVLVVAFVVVTVVVVVVILEQRILYKFHTILHNTRTSFAQLRAVPRNCYVTVYVILFVLICSYI